MRSSRLKSTMIQRIQTIYLLVSVFIIGSLFIWFPLMVDENNIEILRRDEIKIIVPIFLSIVLSFISIFSFKNRSRQMLLNRLNILSNFVLLGVFVYSSLSLSGETLVSEKGIGILLPLISIVALLMANKAIKRDENLVKSVDRLR